MSSRGQRWQHGRLGEQEGEDLASWGGEAITPCNGVSEHATSDEPSSLRATPSLPVADHRKPSTRLLTHRRDDASARRAFSVDGTALEAPLPQRDEATHPRPSALSLLLASLGLDPGPDLPAGQAWFDGPRARAVVCAALVCGVSHFEALGRPRATAPASGAGGSHGGADAAGGQAGGGALSSPGSGQWRALRAMCCLWAALRCGVWGCDGGNARPAASRTAGGDLPGGGAGSCGRDPLWRWVCGGGGPEAGSKSLIAWRSLVCDPWLLVAALLDRRWGLTTGKDAEHPLAVAWESARVCLAVAAHQAVVHAVAGWAGGVGWGRAGSAMRAEDLTR